MKKYEYLEVQMGKTYDTELDDGRSKNNALNELGEQGWELVSFYINASDNSAFPRAVLKREI